jgi:hypothetical protein
MKDLPLICLKSDSRELISYFNAATRFPSRDL